MALPAFHANFLKDRVALITGGGTGICRGIALKVAEYGCNVAITSRELGHLSPTRDEIQSKGVRSLALAADVRDPLAVEKVISETVDRLGHLDILINGAAGNFLCPAEKLSPNGFAAVVDIDLKGTFHYCRSALPHLKTARGSILNISATLHYLGTPAQLHVSAAKAGIDALTRNLAVEWGRYGIRVNGIAPGPIDDTEGARRLLDERTRRHIVARNPLGRMGRIDDIANAALFLCSDAAAFINGETLIVDGGQWLTGSLFGQSSQSE
jgi:peroxisomal 2,4-dienoyl-CoA reductase